MTLNDQNAIPPAPPAVPNALTRQVGQAIELLNASERPVVLVGNGVRLAKADQELRQALRLIGAPVLTTCQYTSNGLGIEEPSA